LEIARKSKWRPFTEAEFDILYVEGISLPGSIVDAAIQYGLLEKRDSWLSMDAKQLGQGRDAVRDSLKNDPELQKLLVEKIQAKAKEIHLGRDAGKGDKGDE